MGLFGLLGKDKKKEAEKLANERRADQEREEIVNRQMKEHEKLTWPQIKPISPVRVRDGQGNESIPAILTDPVSKERKDEIGPMVFQPQMNSDTLRFLSMQELIFILTTMETFQKAAPLENFEANRRIVYNEIISRLRDADRIFIMMDLTTGYPYLDHGHTLVYSEEEFARAAAGVLTAQYRRVSVQGYGGEGEPAVSGFFTFMFYMGASSLLLDNGYYG
ncbi:MAG: hypothetical protein K6B72_08835, partial [Lachnospiraceae bacterium]|nr:hypothetical protein [Lachnospiraceae bacterium]